MPDSSRDTWILSERRSGLARPRRLPKWEPHLAADQERSVLGMHQLLACDDLGSCSATPACRGLGERPHCHQVNRHAGDVEPRRPELRILVRGKLQTVIAEVEDDEVRYGLAVVVGVLNGLIEALAYVGDGVMIAVVELDLADERVIALHVADDIGAS
jgi:hypothetical protein